MSEPWGYPEQIRAHDKLVRSRGGVVWWDAGQGKTRIAIEWFDSMRKVYKNEFPCVCLVILKRSAFLDFRKELQKLDYDAVVLEDDLIMPDSVEIATLQKPTLLLVSAAMFAKSVDSLLVDPHIKYAIIDELWMYKNPKAARSLCVQKFSERKRNIGLSGSIMTAEDIVDIWGQLKAVNKHMYVARNLTDFRSKFLNMTMVKLKSGKEFPYRAPKPGAYKRIMELCEEVVDFHFPENSKRKITIQKLSVPSTPEQDKAFHELKEWMEVEVDGKIIEYNNRLEVALRIQQIANGWILDDNRVIRKIKSNKMTVLVDKVKELDMAGKRVIIWCAFRHDVKEVMAALFSAQIATVQFVSGERFDDQRWEKGEARVCVATEGMGVSVNHFEQVAYAFYFSTNYKWMDMQQSMKRTDRFSSLHPEAFYYFLQVEGSLDAAILRKVNSSRDWEKQLINIGEQVTQWATRK